MNADIFAQFCIASDNLPSKSEPVVSAKKSQAILPLERISKMVAEGKSDKAIVSALVRYNKLSESSAQALVDTTKPQEIVGLKTVIVADKAIEVANIAPKVELETSEQSDADVKLTIVTGNDQKVEVVEPDYYSFLATFCVIANIPYAGNFLLELEQEHKLGYSIKNGKVCIKKQAIASQSSPNQYEGHSKGKMSIRGTNSPALYENAIYASATRIEAIKVTSGIFWERPLAVTSDTPIAIGQQIVDNLYSVKLDNRLIADIEWNPEKKLSGVYSKLHKYLLVLPTNLMGLELERWIEANSLNPKAFNLLGVKVLYQNGKQVFPSSVVVNEDNKQTEKQLVSHKRLSGGLNSGMSLPFQALNGKWFQVRVGDSVKLYYLPNGANSSDKVNIGTIGLIESVQATVERWVQLIFDKEGETQVSKPLASWLNKQLAMPSPDEIIAQFPVLANIKVDANTLSALVPSEERNLQPRAIVLKKKDKPVVTSIFRQLETPQLMLLPLPLELTIEITRVVQKWIAELKAIDYKDGFLPEATKSHPVAVVTKCVPTTFGKKNVKNSLDNDAQLVAKMFRIYANEICTKGGNKVGRLLTPLSEDEIKALSDTLVTEFFKSTGKSVRTILFPESKSRINTDESAIDNWAGELCRYVWQLVGVRLEIEIDNKLITNSKASNLKELVTEVSTVVASLAEYNLRIKWQALTLGDTLAMMLAGKIPDKAVAGSKQDSLVVNILANSKLSNLAKLMLSKQVIKANVSLQMSEIVKL